MSKTKVTKIDVLAETKYLKLYNAEYINKNGETRNWAIASRKDLDTVKNKFFNGAEDDIDAVIIVATHVEQNKIVIIRQFRVPINDYVYELPAGLVDSGEDFITTVKRELKEETGLDLIQIDYEKSKTKAYVSTGMTDECISLIYCTCKGNISQKYLEADEDIEAMLLSKEEAIELINSGKKIDIKALFAIQNM
ncbi:ADP-ribose pyrophosphatase [Clostridium tepidiprofundi DSM 19306]|uniref:ADP-ribose pyrophosphatase n=1 Tax=Clostridium tepidiprofundi DSM 19306 TaxID=1121338 RepID=A0A151B362_9CLOT|nr:NUDIX hydrolase [Clostridium tepidiprofundi]KYH34336.1 ADP-ribose pyrophosphatase [Clostridium tepidiprofundi DSM 19306]